MAPRPKSSKPKRSAILFKMVSTAGTGYFYTARRNTKQKPLHILFEGDAFIAAEILSVSNVLLFASTHVVRGSHITCSGVNRSVQIPSRCQSLGRKSFSTHKNYSLKTGPLEHLVVIQFSSSI